jgi:predicted DNA-binding transcriptional regulator AlpA
MELNENVGGLHGLRIDPKKAIGPQRGLNRDEAATYIGVPPSLFDDLVRSGTMPRPVRIKSRTV